MSHRMIVAVIALMLAAQLLHADELTQRIPAGANALMVIDVAALKSTPLAQTQGWARKHETAFVERPLILPAEASRIVVGSQLNFAVEMNMEWEVAAMDLLEPLSMPSIARAEGGYLDRVAGVDCAWTPSEAYFVPLSERRIGLVYPANRQFVSRWTQGNTGVLSSGYLLFASRQVDRTTQVVMAIDLQDVPQPHRLRERLQASPTLQSLSSRLEAIEKLILGVQGLTLRISVGQSARGVLRVDFNDSPVALGAQAKPLVLEVLDNFGARLPGFDQWTVKLEAKSILLEGELGTDALRRVFSLLELPTTKFSTLKGEVSESLNPASAAPSPSVKAVAAVAYFKGVSVLIEDLRRTLDDTRDNHAVWMERYARKVDALPVLNVDDDLLAWGAGIGETFRVMALAQRASGIKSGIRKSSVYGNYQYNYDQYGSAYSRSTASVKTQIETEERGQAKAVRYNSWKEIEDATAAVRKEMTKRYQVEF